MEHSLGAVLSMPPTLGLVPPGELRVRHVDPDDVDPAKAGPRAARDAPSHATSRAATAFLILPNEGQPQRGERYTIRAEDGSGGLAARGRPGSAGILFPVATSSVIGVSRVALP